MQAVSFREDAILFLLVLPKLWAEHETYDER